MKPKVSILLLIGAGAYTTILMWGIGTERRSKAIHTELEAEFKALLPFPGATSVRYNSRRKLTQAYVGNAYLTADLFPEIRAHYDSALFSRGWSFVREETFSSKGADVVGSRVVYRKGEFFAWLDYGGQRASYGWDFSLDLSWGL